MKRAPNNLRTQLLKLAVAVSFILAIYWLSQDCSTPLHVAGTKQSNCAVCSKCASTALPSSVFQNARQQQQSFCAQDKDSIGRASSSEDGHYFRRASVPVGLGTAGFNISFWLHAKPDIVSEHINRTGYWEWHETDQILSFLAKFEQETGLKRQEVYFMDIGANVGWFSLNAAAMGYQVAAFEPMLPNQGAIRRTLCSAPALPWQLTLFATGLSNKKQTCSFFADGPNLGNGYTGCDVDEGSSTMEGKTLLGKFDLAVLDDFLAEDMARMAGRVGVLKIDVEGFESRVFEGGLKFMRTVQPRYVLCEVNGPAMRSSTGAKPEDVFRMFKDLGYEVRLGSFDGEVQHDLESLGDKTGATLGFQNFYFCKL